MNTNDRQTHPASAVSTLYEQAMALQQKWGVPHTRLQGVHRGMPTHTAVGSRPYTHTCIDAGVGEPTGQETARPGQLMQGFV